MFTVRFASKRKYFLFLSLIIMSLFFLSSTLNLNRAIVGYSLNEFSISLVLKTNGGGTRPDVCLYIASYLEEIGIDVEVRIEEWVVFLGTLLLTHDFDLAYVGLGGGGATPDMRDVYTEDGSLNIFGLTQEMPYGNLSETMQQQSVITVNPEERQQLLYDFQQLMMDKIVPMLPFYSARNYVGIWVNTLGYDARWGLADSLPYMSYSGYHDGQDSLDEFNIASANWRDLNPLMADDGSSSLIQGLLMEPIVQMNPDFAPLKTGLVYEWDQIDETHYQFWMLDDVYWNPSYNSEVRDSNSAPLADTPNGELMVGLKNGEYSNGANQQVTAKDAIFTYLAWGNNVVSESTSNHEWISDIYVDSVDELSFHIHIDGDPDTPEIEPFADMWAKLPWLCLPEFFLNSTSSAVTYTEGGVETTGLYPSIIDTPQWLVYSESAFGCGKYSLDYAIPNSVTVLERSPYWFGKGAKDGATGMEPFVDNVNIRVIPDSSAELAEFKAGKLDIGGLTEFSAERKQMQADLRFEVQSFLKDYMTFLAFNMRRPFIGGSSNDVFLMESGKEEYTRAAAIRKAICYAIDRDAINQQVYNGEYFICHSTLYPSNTFYYYNDIVKYNYDLDASKEWLDAAKSPVPILKLTVDNHDKVGQNITFIADYTTGPDVTSSTLYYSVNGGDVHIVPMIYEAQNYYTFNLGSDYVEDTLIDFLIVATNIYGDEYVTNVYSFLVGTKNKALASYPFISLLTLLVIPVIITARRRKNKK